MAGFGFFAFRRPIPTVPAPTPPDPTSPAPVEEAVEKKNVVEEQSDQVMALLDRFFQALESGTAKYLSPELGYSWKYYKGEVTIERLRAGLIDLDKYMAEQHIWVNNNSLRAKQEGPFDAAPELSQLPDAAVWLMFQELDNFLG